MDYQRLARVERALKRPEEARQLLRLAIRIDEEHNDRPNQVTASSYLDLAKVEQGEGRLDDARLLILRAIEICRQVGDGDSIYLANGYHDLGRLEWERGHRAEGRGWVTKSLHMWECLTGATSTQARSARRWLAQAVDPPGETPPGGTAK